MEAPSRPAISAHAPAVRTLQPLEVLERLDLLVGVEEELGRKDAARNRRDAELILAVLEPHLGTPRLEQVHQQLFGLKAAGHPGEDDRRLVDPPVVTHPVVSDLGHSGFHDVGDLEILAEHAGREHIHLDVAVGHGLDQLGVGVRVLEEHSGQGGRHGPLLGGHAGERCDRERGTESATNDPLLGVLVHVGTPPEIRFVFMANRGDSGDVLIAPDMCRKRRIRRNRHRAPNVRSVTPPPIIVTSNPSYKKSAGGERQHISSIPADRPRRGRRLVLGGGTSACDRRPFPALGDRRAIGRSAHATDRKD